MQSRLTHIVRTYGKQVNDGRSLQEILDHLKSEVIELQEEIDNGSTGEDGIVGEAIDIIACALDIVFQYKPDIKDSDLNDIMNKKCAKWARKAKKNEQTVS